jgi:UDP-glucose 4-epimerase
MNVLVTGASTPLGRALVAALLADPRVDVVLAVGRGMAAHPKLTQEDVDLTRSRHLRRLLFGPAKELAIDAVAHVAISPTARHVDVDATRELLYLAERHPTLRRFVHRSFSEIYRIRPEGGGIIGEGHPLDLSLPRGVRNGAEADLTVCTRMGMAPSLSIAVLRLAELFAPGCGSQLYDYLSSKVCFRPLGFDPMIQLISLEDAVRALVLALFSDAQGVFNIPGADVLPLSQVIALAGRRGVAVPGPLLGPLYGARSLVRGTEFRYESNRFRFHYSGVLDGRRAERVLGYTPSHRIRWNELEATRAALIADEC